MNLRIIKILLINIIILNYFNLSIGSDLIIPKNKPLINNDEIKLNEVNYLLPKKKPILGKNQIIPKKKEEIKKLSKSEKKIEGIILPQPKPIVVSKIKPPKMISQFIILFSGNIC